MNDPFLRHCPSCEGVMLVPASALSEHAPCAACGADLGPHDAPLDVPDRDFFHRVTDAARVPLLMAFGAPWCERSRAMSPMLAALAQRSAGRALVLKLNTELCPELAARFDVDRLPRFALFKDGQWTLTDALATESPAQVDAWLTALTSH